MTYKEFATTIAKEAGTVMKNHFKLGMARTIKADASPVTEADLAINSLLIQKVREQFPIHNVRGEEESNIISDSDFLWVCDPVDGTIPFSGGLPLSTFSLALVQNGEPILGVVYDPFCDRLFFAEKGTGAFLNDTPIHVSSKNTLDRAMIEYETWRYSKYEIRPLMSELEKRGAIIMHLCSIANPSALVAAGEFVATFFPHNTAHDIAAVKVIVEEAGGKVTDIFGNNQRYDQPINGAIVSNGAMHDELVELAKQLVTEK